MPKERDSNLWHGRTSLGSLLWAHAAWVQGTTSHTLCNIFEHLKTCSKKGGVKQIDCISPDLESGKLSACWIHNSRRFGEARCNKGTRFPSKLRFSSALFLWNHRTAKSQDSTSANQFTRVIRASKSKMFQAFPSYWYHLSCLSTFTAIQHSLIMC